LTIFNSVNRWIDQNKENLIRLLGVTFVLSFALLLAPRVALRNRIPTLLFLLVIGGLSGLVILRWPALSLIVTILGGIFIPFTGPSGTNVAVLGVALAIGLWVFEMIVKNRKIEILHSRTFAPVIAFILFSSASFLIGQIPWFVFANQAPVDAQLGGFAIFILSFGMFIVVPHLIRDIRWLEVITWMFIVCGTVYIAGRTIRLGFIDRIFYWGFSAGSLFWTWLVALTFGQFAFNRKLNPLIRLVLGGVLMATFYVAIVQAYDWKSGWLPPLAAVAAIIGIRFWRKLIYFSPLALIPLIYLIQSSIGSDEYSWGTRIDAWIIVLQIARASPIFGLGFANYYWYTPLFPIRGWRVSFNSHSQYVDLIAQTGILGLLCFLWVFWEVGKLGWKLREMVPNGFSRGYVYGTLGGVVGTLVAAALVDWVLPFTYNIGFNGFRASILGWMFMGGLVSLEQLFGKSEKLSAQGMS
jgi:hypothetical protein